MTLKRTCKSISFKCAVIIKGNTESLFAWMSLKNATAILNNHTKIYNFDKNEISISNKPLLDFINLSFNLFNTEINPFNSNHKILL